MKAEGNRRKICVFTGTRADYGHLYHLMKLITADSDLQLQTLVSGSHMCAEFGNTAADIENDGFVISARVDMQLNSDTPAAITRSMGIGLQGFATALEQLQPDILVILGDRFEALTMAQAAMLAGIPIAHLHGGETSEGAIDEMIRHAISKMAHYHFTAAEPYRQRVIQMGENPLYCFNFGAPGLDHLQHLNFLSREELQNQLNFVLHEKNYLVTYHPATMGNEDPREAFAAILKACTSLPEAGFFFTFPNADTAGRQIISMIEEYVRQNPRQAGCCANLGQLRYLSLMRLVDAVIGNSSSGLVEAPAMRVPTINTGIRQQGRLRSHSIIDVAPESEAILSAIRQCDDLSFRSAINSMRPAYGMGNVSEAILAKLKELPAERFMIKKFFDLPGTGENRQ